MTTIEYASYGMRGAACLPGAVHQVRHDVSMSARRPPGPGRKPRGGIIRTRTTVRLLPEDKEEIEARADELGLSLTDTLAYFVALGAGMRVPPDIQMLIDQNKRLRETQDILVA